jgi:hypothetical protein
MKQVCIALFILLLINISFAQQVDLTGAIIIGRAEMMSYKIVYQVNEKNIVSGFSISDQSGDNETKSKISGIFNPRKKTLQFEEKSIISTKTKLDFNDFCLMNVKGKFSRKSGKTVFTGSFHSKSANKLLICDSGTIILTTTKDILELEARAMNMLGNTKITDSSINIDEKLAPLLGVDKVRTLEPGKIADYTLATDVVQIEIIDDRLEDGDKISIYRNNKIVVSELAITNKVQNFKFDIDKSEKIVVFTFLACNEGTSPPNTLKVILTNGEQKELLIAQLKKDQSVRIQLKR